MRKFIGFLLVTIMIIGLSACSTHRYGHGRIPPGHAKKIYGDKSAKRYAPGQQKKKWKKNKKYKGNNGNGKGNKRYKHDVSAYPWK